MSRFVPLPYGERYRLEHLLGQGGMGSVYRAYDRLTGQRVALKWVTMEPLGGPLGGGHSASLGEAATMALNLHELANLNESGGEPSRQSAFRGMDATEMHTLRLSPTTRVPVSVGTLKSSTHALWARVALAQEFRTLASLRHPHIISVLDYGFIARTQPFFTMELLENARRLGAASQGLSIEARALLLMQLLRALSYLHRRAILHRDLKPANVLVQDGSGGPMVKLLDFGLALARSHAAAKSGELSGTLSYMAPELFQGRPATEAADLFAVGVMAYELFAERHPFEHEDDGRLVSAILYHEPAWEPFAERPALGALLRRLLAKSPEVRPSADETLAALAQAVRMPLSQESVALRESTLQAARFIGRDALLQTLRGALAAAQVGTGEVRLLAGESGVGKSRLMEELRVHALVQGVLSVRGQAVSEGGGAYGIWREVLRALSLCTTLDDLEASVLKTIVPDLESLLERPIPDAAVLHPQAAQLRLVKVIESLLTRQAEPLLILLEDLHWADAESLMLLRRLVPECKTRPILILASYRDDEAPNLKAELPDCAELTLSRLSTSQIAELCQAMLGEKGCTPELVNFLAAETEGNVLFIIGVTRALAEEAGELERISSQALPKHMLTGGIQAVVQRRLARLPEAARPLLGLAAVAGRQLDLKLLRHFEPEIESWLYLAASAAVLEVNGETWRFAHDKIRESLLLEMTPPDRERLHLLIAQAMEHIYSGSASHAAIVAEHYQRGGDLAKAVRHKVLAGTYALRQGATEQAAALLRQALAKEARGLLPRLEAARAYNHLIQAEVALGRFAESAKNYEEFLSHVGLPMPEGFAMAAAAGLAAFSRRLRKSASRSKFTEEERRVQTEVAHATRWAGETYVWVGQPAKSIVLAMRGAELADEIGDTGLLVHYLAGFGYLAGLIPLPQVSQMFLNQGARLLKGLASVRTALDFERIACVLHINAAKWELAQAELDALIVHARQVGDEYSLMFGLSFRFILAFRRGEDAVFDAYGPELYERAKRNQSGQFARTYPLYQGLKALRGGDFTAAHRLLTEADGFVHTTQDMIGRILLGGVLALCYLGQGERELALRRADETLGLAESARMSVDVVVEGVSALVEVYLTAMESADRMGQRRFIHPLRRAFAALRRCARVFPYIVPRTLLWYGRAAFRRGAPRLAYQLAQASERKAQKLRLPYDEALARTWLARFTAPRGK